MQPQSEQPNQSIPPVQPTPVDPTPQPPYVQPVQQPVVQQPAQPPQPGVAAAEPTPTAPVQPLVQQQTEVPVPTTEDFMAQRSVQPTVLQWQASEFITREKNSWWFVVLGLVTVALCAVAIFLMNNITFALLVVVMAVALVVIARRPARDMLYQLSTTQLVVNDKPFTLHDFRAFGVMQEGAVYSVSLAPVKRFRPNVNVYFPSDLGEQIVDLLGSVLPMEDMKPDVIDRITERLNF